jgi:hypothetical protein
MRNLILSLSTFMLFVCGLNSQNCIPGSVLFSSQQEIDNFTVNYPGCTRITGNIIIQGADIDNLEGFAGVIFIGGSITISNNPELLNLSGLSSLDTVVGNFFIQHNDTLVTLQDLSSLDYVGGTLEVSGNESLTCISGLSSLGYIGGSLTVRNNLVLTCFEGLTNLDTIGGNLILDNNQALTSLNGLSALKVIGESFNIYNNLSLNNLNGLNSLKVIGGNLDIFNNQSLTSLSGIKSLMAINRNLLIRRNLLLKSISGLTGLMTLNGFLSITLNESLTNLCGLENIDYQTVDSISISDNDVLAICNAKSICDYLSEPKNPASISNNAEGCSSRQEIIDECEIPFDCALLPVELIRFEGYNRTEGNLLEWTTASEINNDYFEVERSKDGLLFTNVGMVIGSGNSSHQLHYKWLDKIPLNGINYYRLRQVDYDGKYAYSGIVAIFYSLKADEVKISPNPTSDLIYLTTDNKEQQIAIYDGIGNLVEILDFVPNQISLVNYKNGMYFVRAGNKVIKLIVQH